MFPDISLAGAAQPSCQARTMIRGSFLRTIFFTFLLSLSLWGCDAVDSVKEGFAHSQAVSAELEKSLGLKSFVGFNWNNGSLTAVTITFDGIPKDRSLSEISETATRAVLNEFKQEPTLIVVSFTIKQ
jgi:hypothetical protein